MSLLRFMKWIGIMTIMALFYIHMQMQIYALGYQRIAYEKQIRKLLEKNGDVTHTILTLTSASNLGKNILEKDSKMRFVDPQNIVSLKPSPQRVAKTNPAQQKVSKKTSNPLLSLLSFEGEAQAKPIKE